MTIVQPGQTLELKAGASEIFRILWDAWAPDFRKESFIEIQMSVAVLRGEGPTQMDPHSDKSKRHTDVLVSGGTQGGKYQVFCELKNRATKETKAEWFKVRVI